ncbi:MAG: LEPR-XLL domain-containing protein, partial [Halioglobus sp.]
MNKPVCIAQTREQLLQRLSTRRPLYQAIKENLPKSKGLHAELMEPRVLLSADLVPVAGELSDGLTAAGDAIDDFFDATLLDKELPLLVFPKDDVAGTPEKAPSIEDLMAIDVGSDARLTDYDLDGPEGIADGKVSLKEFFDGAFVEPLKAELVAIGASEDAVPGQDLTDIIRSLGGDFSASSQAFDATLYFSVDDVTFLETADSVEWSLSFSLSVATASVPFDLGTKLESDGLTIEGKEVTDGDLTTRPLLDADVTTSLTFNFSFGVDGITPATLGDDGVESEDDTGILYDNIEFYAKLGDIAAETVADIEYTADKLDARFGFLGLNAGLDVSLIAGVTSTAAESQKLRTSDTTIATGSLDGSLSTLFSSAGPTIDSGLTGSINLGVASASGLALDSSLVDVTLQYNLNPFDPFLEVNDGRFVLPGIITAGNLDLFANFELISSSSYIGLIEQLAQSLDVVGNSGDISDYELPFANTSFGELVSFSDTLIDALIFDEGATDAADDDTAGLLMRDANGQLVPAFNTVQELAGKLTDLAATSVDGLVASEQSGFVNPTLAYNGTPGKEALTLSLELTSTFAEVDVPLEFNLDLEPLASVALTQGALKATATGRINLTVGVDLSGGTAKTLTPETKLDGSATSETTTEGTLTTELGSPIEGAELAITGDPLPLKSYTDSNAIFKVKLSDVPTSFAKDYTVTVSVFDGDRLRSAGEIASDIHATLNDDLAIRTYIDAEKSFSGGIKFFSRGDSTFEFVDANDVALEVLGLSGALKFVDTDDGPEAISKIFSTDPSQEGAPSAFGASVGIPADFTVSSEVNLTINDKDIPFDISSTDENTNIRALASDLQQAINDYVLEANDPSDPLSLGYLAEVVVKDADGVESIKTVLKSKINVSSVRSELVFTVVNGADGAPLLNELALGALPALGLSAQTENYTPGTGEVSSADFLINAADGQTFEISLAGLDDIQALIDEVHTESGGEGSSDPTAGDYVRGDVTLLINEAGTALELIDNTFIPLVENSDETITDNNLQRFEVLAVNGSVAAYQLGISGADDADPENYDGKIEGSTTVAGKTLADRLFVDDVTLTAGVGIANGLAAEDLIKANASFGFVDVVLTDGQVELGAEIAVGLKNPDDQTPLITTDAGSKRITLAQFKESFGSVDDVKKLIATPTLTGTAGGGTDFATIDLTLGLESDLVPGLGTAADLLGASDINIKAKVTGLSADGGAPDLVFFDKDLGDFGGYNTNLNFAGLFDGLPIFDLSSVGISEILDGIIAVSDFLQGFEEFGFLSEDIPLIELSVNDLLSFADQLDAAVQSSLDDPAGSLQGLQSALVSALGLAQSENPEDSPVQFSLVGSPGSLDSQVLRVDIALVTSVSESVGLDFDLGKLNTALAGTNLAGSADLRADGSLALNVAFGIDLGVGSNSTDLGDIWLFADKKDVDGEIIEFGTSIVGGLDVFGDDLTFRAAAGPLGLYIQQGKAEIEVDATAGIGINDLLILDASSTDLISFEELSESVTTSLTGDLYAALPVYFPTDSILAGDIEFYTGNVALGDNLKLLELTTADFKYSGVTEILNSFNPLELSLLDNIALVVDGVDLFLAGLQDILDGEIGGVALPLIGDSLSDGARFIEDFRNGFVDDFREAVATLDSSEGAIIEQMLEDLLTDLGLNASVTTTQNIFGDNAAPIAESFIQWNLELSDEYTISEGIDLDLGIPGLGLETEGDVSLTIDWGLNLALGLDFVNGAYLDFGTEEEGEGDLRFGVMVGLPTSIKGSLGFLQLTAEEKDGGPVSGLTADFAVDIIGSDNKEAGVVGFANLGSISFAPSLSASADVDLDLDLEVKIGDGANGVFPKIASEFVLDWDLDVPADEFGEIGDAIGAGLNEVAFKDVNLDLGSFLSDFLAPTLGAVQDVTEPLADIIDFITAPLPVISDLGPSLSLVDIAEVFGDVDLGFIDSVADVVALVNAIDAGAEEILVPYGDFTIYKRGDGENGTDAGDANLSDPRADLSGLANDPDRRETTSAETLDSKLAKGDSGGGASKLSKLKSAGSFAIPLFDDPTQVFGLFTGGDATLLTFDMKPLTVDFEYSQYFPIFGPLGAAVTGSLGLTADLAFGFDTTGISQFADSDFRNPEYIFNGFYVSDTENPDGTGADVPELTLNLGLSASAELNLGIAKGGAGGGVYADIFFNLYDPNDDGRVRIEELLGSIENQIQFSSGAAKALAPLAIFDVTGEIYAKLFAYLTLGIGPFSVDYDFDITPPITILDFEIPFERPPQLLSEVDGGAVQLNFGELAEFRGEGDLSDSDDVIKVRQVGTSLFVEANEMPEIEYRNLDIQKIVILSGAGNDTIDVSAVSAGVIFDIDGGAGNDTITLPSAAPAPGATNMVLGGAGDDTIYGSDGRDIIIGGDGFDKIYGGGGDDRLFGDSVKLSDNQIQVSLGGTDVTDIIEGGDGNDIIAGGGGADNIDGGIGNDLILGDGGILQVLVEENGELVLEESGLGLPSASVWAAANITVTQSERNGGGNDTIEGDDGDDIVYAGRGDDTVRGGDDDDTLYGETGADTIYGELDDDIIFGADGADKLYGDSGNDSIYGGDGGDLIEGNGGDDSLLGGFGSDLIFGDEGNDRIRGGGDPDLIYGDTGAGYLDSEGDPRIRGGSSASTSESNGSNRDYLDGEYGDDELYGELDGDQLVSSFGNDILDGGVGGDFYKVTVSGGTADREVQTVEDAANADADTLIVAGAVDAVYRSEFVSDGNPLVDLEVKDTNTTFDAASEGNSTTPGFAFNSFSDAEFDLILKDTANPDDFLLRASDSIGFVAALKKGESFDESAKTELYQAAVDARNTGTEQEFQDAKAAYESAADFPVERINYTGATENIKVYSGKGADAFQLDGNRASTQIDGGDDADRFQIGQVYNVPRDGLFLGGNIQALNPELDDLYALAVSDVYVTELTTRGYLSHGVDIDTVIDGGNGDDKFIVFRNDAVLTLNGGEGKDNFEVRAFALGESVEAPDQSRTDISGGANADSVLYAVNADVNIDGGAGEDTVALIGTEFGDDFVVTADGIFGAGLSVNYKNIEILRVDGAEGDDRFFIQSTGAGVKTEVVGGLGSDSFNVAGDAPPVVTKDLKGHSGTISHTIVTAQDSNYAEVRVRDVVANVGDSDSPGIVVIPESEVLAVNTADSEFIETASYSLVLTRPPGPNETVRVTVSAPKVGKLELVQFLGADANNKVQVDFTASNWSTPQKISFQAPAEEISGQSGYLLHDLKVLPDSAEAPFTLGSVSQVNNEFATVSLLKWDDGTTPPDNGGAYRGGSFTILGDSESDEKGETRKIEGYNTTTGTFTLASSWNLVPDALVTGSPFKVVLTDGTELTGTYKGATNSTTLSVDDLGAQLETLITNAGPSYDGDLRGATITYFETSADGKSEVTESRLIVDNTATEIVLNTPWENKPSTNAKFTVELFSEVRLPSIEVSVNKGNGTPSEDNPVAPGVKVIESKGSTDVLEPFGSTNSGEAYQDSYQLVLTDVPTHEVKVYLQPESTLTTRGLISNKDVQVDIVANLGDVQVEEDVTYIDTNGDTVTGDRYYVLFEAGDNTAKTVFVEATDDDEFDGGDTKVFPTIPRTVGEIQGELILYGAGVSERSLGSLSNPLLLPGENNTLPKIGDIVSAFDSPNGQDTVTVKASIINTLISPAQLDLVSVKDLIDYTFTVASGPGQGQQLIIGDVPELPTGTGDDATYTFTFREDYQWNSEDLPDDTSGFAIDQTNPNLLVDENEQVDIVTVFNNEAVADQDGEDGGRLTDKTLTGFAMGATLSYFEMENFTLNLGKGSDELTVDSTHSMSSAVETVTLVNAGRGADVITVNLDDKDGFFVVRGEEGNDTINAAASTLGIIAFGDEGSDTLIGGSGADLLLGDIARVDYVDEDGKVVTRLGLEHDFGTMDRVVTSEEEFSGRVPDDQTAFGFSLEGLPSTIVSLDRNTIDVELPKDRPTDNAVFVGATIEIIAGVGKEQTRTIDKFDGTSFEVAVAWDGTPDNSSAYLITLTDGTELTGDVKRAANNINNNEDGADTLRGNGGDDILIGGAADDRIDGGADTDLILGDNALITRDDDGGSLSILEQDLIGGGRLYDLTEDEVFSANVGVDVNPNGGAFDLLNLTLLHPETGEETDYFGNDYIAGGAGDDFIFGQKGTDTIQGDGDVPLQEVAGSDSSETGETLAESADVGAVVDEGVLTVIASVDGKFDGNDYIEGNDGEDTVFGNLGQDTIIGGSSDLFGLDSAAQRADGSDKLFGGSGNYSGSGTDDPGNPVDRYNDAQGLHARDADLILGDNARVASITDVFYNFDEKFGEDERNIVRAYTLLDYAAGPSSDVGAADEIHGEGGDDIILGMTGNDLLFGGAQDDNIIGGDGSDRIYGGNGVDGVLGDNGIIQTSRNGQTETLNGLTTVNEQELLEPKGKGVGAWIHPLGDIHKSVEIEEWADGGNDIIYGGLGEDFLHGGAGDDAISGAEALAGYYNSLPQDDAIPDLATEGSGKDLMFALFDADEPRGEIEGFILNFDITIDDVRAEDGVDRIFGGLGNDWLVGGTGTDRIFGGLGN